jgi:hypothetical protein
MKQFLKGFMIMNVLDNANTQIPVENGFAMLRNASLADMEANRLITFAAQRPPSQKGKFCNVRGRPANIGFCALQILVSKPLPDPALLVLAKHTTRSLPIGI